MNAYGIGAIVGAVIFAYLWSRLWLWLVGKVVKSDARRLVVAYGLAWSTAVVFGAFGFSDGGSPAWLRALSIYTPSLVLWLAVDLLARRGRKG